MQNPSQKMAILETIIKLPDQKWENIVTTIINQLYKKGFWSRVIQKSDPNKKMLAQQELTKLIDLAETYKKSNKLIDLLKTYKYYWLEDNKIPLLWKSISSIEKE